MFQFISHFTDRFSYEDGIRLVLKGGCKWVQLRMKDASAEQIEAVAAVVAPLCRESGARFILDDHVELVERTGADGVHLGKMTCP